MQLRLTGALVSCTSERASCAVSWTADLETLEKHGEIDDDRFLENYRQRRIQELLEARQAPRFGECGFIRRSDWRQEVTGAANGTWVVVHLWKEHVSTCVVLQQCIDELARKFPNTKFVRIVSTEASPGYPDTALPTLLLYKDGNKVKDFVGMEIFGGRISNPEEVAMKINSVGPVLGTDSEDQQRELLTDMVRRVAAERAQDVEDEDSDFD
ncbi:unnamed protein product [Pedinophyceae sp. YPF-701]|nr:unnamed protein product [Pedinophyceae sp. YPF-701]